MPDDLTFASMTKYCYYHNAKYKIDCFSPVEARLRHRVVTTTLYSQ